MSSGRGAASPARSLPPVAPSRPDPAPRGSARRPAAPTPGQPAAGGLGRDLAGILRDSRGLDGSGPTGLQHLVGRQPSTTPPRLRQFVIDTALAVIAERFGAEAVVVARRDGPGGPPVVATRIPPSWDEAPNLTFELFGRLWSLLALAGPPAGEGPGSEVIRVGDRHGWLGRHGATTGDLVAAVVRAEPFTADDEATLARVVRSVAAAAAPVPRPDRQPAGLTVRAEAEGEGWRAEVAVCGSGGRPGRATARAGDRELAVARAAALAAGGAGRVAFAGRSALDGAVVDVVVLLDREHSPLLGVVASAGDGPTGPAEAVLAALASIGRWRP